MSDKATLTWQEKDACFVIEGPLAFSTVVSLWERGNNLLKNKPSITIDLKAVTHSDSAGLALLVAWMREARVANVGLRFIDLPTQLCAMAKVCGLEAILPI